MARDYHELLERAKAHARRQWVGHELVAELADAMAQLLVLQNLMPARGQPLTKRQAEVLAYVRGYVAGRGYAPTFEEIAEEFNYSSLSTVSEHLRHLEQKGHIRRNPTVARGIVVLTDPAALDGAGDHQPHRFGGVL